MPATLFTQCGICKDILAPNARTGWLCNFLRNKRPPREENRSEVQKIGAGTKYDMISTSLTRMPENVEKISFPGQLFNEGSWKENLWVYQVRQ